jgi:hypothetical protein
MLRQTTRNLNHYLKAWRKALVATIALVSVLATPAIALAKGTFKPPKDEVPPRTRGTAAGRRDACQSVKAIETGDRFLNLIPLAPDSYLGKTTSTQPTLTWYVQDCYANLPLRISLYEYDANSDELKPQPLFSKYLSTTEGLMALSLEGEDVELEPNQLYAWVAVIEYSKQNPSKNAYSRRPIQVVPASAELTSSLATAPTPAARIELYAENGLWYDAIATAVEHINALDPAMASENSSQADPVVATMRSLISDLADLEELKEPPLQPDNHRFSHSLRQVLGQQELDADSIKLVEFSQ